jgi:hypothetical protein
LHCKWPNILASVYVKTAEESSYHSISEYLVMLFLRIGVTLMWEKEGALFMAAILEKLLRVLTQEKRVVKYRILVSLVSIFFYRGM